MIRAEHITVDIEGHHILRGLSCHVPCGQLTAIIGPNGAGKTTLLKTLSGEYSTTTGQVTIGEELIQSFSTQQLANCRAVLSQQTRLAYSLKVSEVIEIGSYNRYYALTAKQRTLLQEQIVNRLDLQNFQKRAFLTLSGGEQQRVLLAKCLLQLMAGRAEAKEQYLLLDEPTAALDIAQQYHFFEQLKTLAKAQQIGVLAIVHDLNLAARYADQIILLKNGIATAIGGAWEVFEPAKLRNAFAIECLVQPHPHFNVPLITTYGNHKTATRKTSYA